MSLPKEVQDCLEKMLAVLTLKEKNDLTLFLMDRSNQFEFENELSDQLIWGIQAEEMEQDWVDTEWMSSDGLTEDEVTNDNENYLLELEGK